MKFVKLEKQLKDSSSCLTITHRIFYAGGPEHPAHLLISFNRDKAGLVRSLGCFVSIVNCQNIGGCEGDCDYKKNGIIGNKTKQSVSARKFANSAPLSQPTRTSAA